MNRFKKYIGLWLILFLGLAAVVAIAFIDDIKIGELTLKKAPIKDYLLTEVDTATAIDSVKNLEAEADGPAELDTTPQNFLIIGDSMTWNLALRLAEYAEANGHDIHTVNWDSSSTKTWGDCDTLRHFINKFNPSYVFVSLGANEIFLKDASSRKKCVESILAQIGDRPYVWIGPPNWKEGEGVNDMIESMCVPGSFFRTAGMKFQLRKDGIHPTEKASALWLDSVARWIPQSAHPIVMNLPPDTLKINKFKRAQMTILKPKK